MAEADLACAVSQHRIRMLSAAATELLPAARALEAECKATTRVFTEALSTVQVVCALNMPCVPHAHSCHTTATLPARCCLLCRRAHA